MRPEGNSEAGSMSHKLQHQELEQARELLAKADEHVALQETRVEELRADGHDTARAEAFLKVLRETREVMKKQLAMIEAEIAAQASPNGKP
jgi:hypothetical protein